MLDANHHEPVFIVGAARSGTTLIQSLITAIPGFLSCPETHFFDELMACGPICGGYQLHRPKLRHLKERISEKRLLESFTKARAGFLKIPVQAQEELLGQTRAGLLSPRKYLCALVASCSTALNEHNNRWVEKTPIHASYLKQIFELFPDARVVCVQRDPAGVLRSAAAIFDVPACVVALDYYRTYRDVERFLIHHPSRAEQVFMVSYDKVLCSDEVIEELLKFLKADNVQADTVRNAAKNRFRDLYGNSLMKVLQPKMGDNPLNNKIIVGWKSKAIDGYAALLGRARLGLGGPDEPPQGGSPLHFTPMAADLISGMLYIARWRMRWLISILGSLIFFRSVSR